MRGFVVAAALICAAPALAETLTAQMVCVAAAEGPRGEAVTVFIHVEPNGQRLPAYGSWAPPLLSSSGVGGLDQPDTSLLIGYDAVTKAGLGPANAYAQVLVLSVSPPRQRIPAAKLQARLSRLSGEARFDSGAAVKFGLNQPGPTHQDLPGTAMRTAELTLPTTLPKEIELRLLDKKGEPVVAMRFATSVTTSRDTLFAKAWAEADARTANPADCDPTGGADGYAGVPSG